LLKFARGYLAAEFTASVRRIREINLHFPISINDCGFMLRDFPRELLYVCYCWGSSLATPTNYLTSDQDTPNTGTSRTLISTVSRQTLFNPNSLRHFTFVSHKSLPTCFSFWEYRIKTYSSLFRRRRRNWLKQQSLTLFRKATESNPGWMPGSRSLSFRAQVETAPHIKPRLNSECMQASCHSLYAMECHLMTATSNKPQTE